MRAYYYYYYVCLINNKIKSRTELGSVEYSCREPNVQFILLNDLVN